MKEPKQTRTMIMGLKAALATTQENLKNYPPEEPVQANPETIYGRVFFTLFQIIQNAEQLSKKLKDHDPSTSSHIHIERFPEELYNELMNNHPDLLSCVKELGFEFYMTHNGVPHPMVKFTLEF